MVGGDELGEYLGGGVGGVGGREVDLGWLVRVGGGGVDKLEVGWGRGGEEEGVAKLAMGGEEKRFGGG